MKEPEDYDADLEEQVVDTEPDDDTDWDEITDYWL